MSASRLKLSIVLAGTALSGLTFLAWGQAWFLVTLSSEAAADQVIEVSGDVAAPALAALSLAGLALVGALSIAGPIFRIVLGALETAIGFSVVLSAALALLSPVAASTPLVTKATGVSGVDSVASLVTEVSQTAWPILALVLGAGMCALGIVIIATWRRWPRASRKYQAARFEPDTTSDASMSDWDTLSDGTDPTSR